MNQTIMHFSIVAVFGKRFLMLGGVLPKPDFPLGYSLFNELTELSHADFNNLLLTKHIPLSQPSLALDLINTKTKVRASLRIDLIPFSNQAEPTAMSAHVDITPQIEQMRCQGAAGHPGKHKPEERNQ